ncbi:MULTISPECIES: hypothetical protein [unclassified Archaeoglobus]|jgi:hypothetical protein|uniref:hypothetical protein n=1 Tax=unclassified Archaeoglobus TaxID=2643606 RepID=UPI0025BB0025|nr:MULTISPECIES: hypothetical protein [unclassified Archaeoglobus]
MTYKVQIRVHVDPEIWEAFKNYVFSKYGTLHKYLGDEISRAMKAYLKDSQNAHTQEFEHMISKPNKKHIKLLVWLLKNYPAEVLYSIVKDYIVDNYGIDKRTIKKYLHDFLINGGFLETLKPIRGNTDLILKVNADRILNYLSKFVPEKELREKYGIYREAFKPTEEVKEEKESKGSIKTYATGRYEAGDSIEEIQDKISDFGLELGKKAIRSMIRKVRRESAV